ncbi:WD40 repeat-like protein [Tricholoma matsutake]|nr:WD40 repeat-like protein [Tricholoma matsutake 945]
MSTSNPSSPLVLPVITIDPTFPTVIQDVDSGIVPSETFWMSCYRASEPSVHANIQVELDEVDRNLIRLKPTEGDVEIVQTLNGTANYTASCKPLCIPPTRLITPVQRYLDPERSNVQRPQRITAFDVSPDGTKFASGFLDGSVFIYPVSPIPSNSSFPDSQIQIPYSITPPIPQRFISKAHLSTVTSLQFFPSSRVLLSAGGDFSLTILPADLPIPSSDTTTGPSTRITPVRTLRGHTRAISSTGIIALGRNILSTSLDSTLKLWDVPSSSCISSLMAHSPILSSSMGERTPVPPDGEEHPPRATASTTAQDEREVPEAQSKLVFCGLQNGMFELFDLRDKASVYRSSPPPLSTAGSLTSIRYNDAHHLLATGSSKGVVAVYDTRALRSDGGVPVTTFRRNEAAIEDLEFVVRGEGGSTAEIGLGIATTDGLPYVADVVPEGPAVGAELVDGECDPVRCVRVRETQSAGRRRLEVWSAADDAVIRRYLI